MFGEISGLVIEIQVLLWCKVKFMRFDETLVLSCRKRKDEDRKRSMDGVEISFMGSGEKASLQKKTT